jgi:hypothetical protein
MPPRKPKVRPRTKTWRVRKNIRAVLSAAEHDRELAIQWLDEELATPSKTGRPRKDYFHSIAIGDGPKGYYTVRFHVSNAYRPFVAVVRKDRKATSGLVKTMTLHEAMREVAKYAWKELGADPARLGVDINNTALWLERKVREKLKDTGLKEPPLKDID